MYLIGGVQAFFLALLLLTKKKKGLSDVFLILFILLMGLRLFANYFSELGIEESYPQLILIEFAFWPLFGPLLFLYIHTITSQNQNFNWSYLLHFIPALTVWIGFSEYIFESHSLHFRDYKQSGIFFKIAMYLWFYTTHFYFILSIIKLHRYHRQIKHFFSYRKSVDLKWLMILTYGFGIFLFTSLFFILTKSYLNIKIPDFLAHIVWLIMVLYIFGIGFFGYKQKGIFRNYESTTTEIMNGIAVSDTSENYSIKHNNKEKNAGQYVKSKVDETENLEILNRLLNYMENEKPYLNCALDLRMLSVEVNTSPHKLSQVINTSLNKNFFEFVNEYRVNEAKYYLKNKQFTCEKIMNIAFDCGFNSKSSFFSIFKKYTLKTPAQFKSEHNKN
ncbi:MAG: AraC family transcriptional regulator [Bacteroidales bacterium]|nr:MAG: AraC family transcriptional regulator [Bacteroidales bacterium]